MGLFKLKSRPVNIELKCPAEECPFTCDDLATLKKHMDWKHPEIAETADKQRKSIWDLSKKF
ncbi:MAG: hypothetical protein JRJ00_10765 [Deltaproteobacteria bacterium]|nr:hypothetical protein [Deltaproteobacteria bacterium]